MIKFLDFLLVFLCLVCIASALINHNTTAALGWGCAFLYKFELVFLTKSDK